ncbi:MAG: hydratase [Mesorhizobium sp.]|nr:MAG: hydratase [Mesorhizobium sp.]RWK82711.1 MAG: hydratase [Mesorhizobium sp.]RWL06518.1 MAG: hydratase [Mesorhizobium sp.]
MNNGARRQRQIDFFHLQRHSASRLDPVPDELRPVDKAEAYAVLSGVHQRMSAAGSVRAGYKIGCTTPETQRAQNTDEPTWAGLFTGDNYSTIDEALANLTPPFALECEIAFRFGRRLCADEGKIVVADIIDAVDACMIGCEIVRNRYGIPLERGLPTLIADDFFQAGYVLGQPVAAWRDLDLIGLAAECRVDGRVVETGISKIVMGNPLNSLRWLAADLARRGRKLEAGDVVLSGSITKPYWLDTRPRTAELQIAGLGVLR